MLKFIVSFLLVLCSIFNLYAQENLIVLKNKIELEAEYFTTDPIGNVYLVKHDNYILKLNAQGDSLGVYNDVRKGKITQIDASNPLRVLVFYGQYGQITILDNMLSAKNQLDLKRIGLFNVPCIANSADANIWIFDPAGNLLKIDEQLNIRFTTPIRNVLDYNINPNLMLESNRELYMCDTAEGIIKFDRFGFYVTRYNFFPKELQVINNNLVYRKDSALTSYNVRALTDSKIILPKHENIVQVRFNRNQLYVLRKKSLSIYAVTQQ